MSFIPKFDMIIVAAISYQFWYEFYTSVFAVYIHICLVYAEEWLNGIIIRSDYIIMQLLCLNVTYVLCQHYD